MALLDVLEIPELFDAVCFSLRPVDVLNLTVIFPHLQPDLKRLYEHWEELGTARIKERLARIGLKQGLIDRFGVDRQITYGRNGNYIATTFIAGSFALQCLLDEWWPESDIDIFTNSSGFMSYHFRQYPDEFIDTNMSYMWERELDANECELYGTDGTYIVRVASIYIPIKPKDAQVQVIEMKSYGECQDIFLDFVMNDFDFNFCKVYFDGDRINVVDWDSIFYRRSTINSKRCSSGRIEKYTERGFTIDQ